MCSNSKAIDRHAGRHKSVDLVFIKAAAYENLEPLQPRLIEVLANMSRMLCQIPRIQPNSQNTKVGTHFSGQPDDVFQAVLDAVGVDEKNSVRISAHEMAEGFHLRIKRHDIAVGHGAR